MSAASTPPAGQSDLGELIARLERATWPDRELDARIIYALRPRMALLGTVDDYLATGVSGSVPAYTASIDAAMTLKPAGWAWRIGQAEHSDLEPFALVYSSVAASCFAEAKHPHAAIALCIAALKARVEEQAVSRGISKHGEG